jgi:hypothetical protein
MTTERPGMVRDPIPDDPGAGQYRRPGDEPRELPQEPRDDGAGSLDLPEDDTDISQGVGEGSLAPAPAL